MGIARALTIAGSDSGGGAGIQADLKSFAALGVHGMSVVSAITAQNTLGVQFIHEVPVEVVETQLRSVVSDIGVDACKTGMLPTPECVEVVAALVRELRLPNLVVDPVLVAKGGRSLMQEEARAALLQRLLPLATVVTPNLDEAAALLWQKVRSLEEMRAAAKALHAFGAKWIVIKGGHRDDAARALDIAYDGSAFLELEAPRIATKNTHGTGCVFSAAIAAGLAKGLSVEKALRGAKDFVTKAIAESYALGTGHGPVNPSATRA